MEISPSLIPSSNQVSETARTSGHWDAASRAISSKWRIKLWTFRCTIFSFFVLLQREWTWQTGLGFPQYSCTGLARVTRGWPVLWVGGSTSYTRWNNGHQPAAAQIACLNIAQGLLAKVPSVQDLTEHLPRDQDIPLILTSWALQAIRTARTSRVTATVTFLKISVWLRIDNVPF